MPPLQFVGQLAAAFDDLAAEALDLVGCHAAEIVVQRFTGFELFAVDQQCVRSRERVAVLVEIAKKCEAACYRRLRSVIVLPEKTGDVVVDQLRGRSVVADDDEAGRHANACLLPKIEGLFVMTVKRFKRRLQLRRQAERVERIVFAPPLLRHFLADVFPEIAEHRHLRARDVVGHGNARQFDDAAFDGIHEREVTHRPREERSFGIA